MDKAKAAVTDFISGHHDTTVHEKVAPAVTQEHVTRTRHEEAQTAIDKEVHQDHYHTSVQPVQHQEVLPEQHSHNIVGVEEREFHHGEPSQIKSRLEQEAAQFKDQRSVGETKHTHAAAPTVAGEHIHHHVHETIQPVVQKETIQPSVVHTTVPIHEVHHNEAKHHAASALPAVSMADFKKQGGALTGREERYDGFEGEPKAVGSALGGSGTTGIGSHTGTHSGTRGTEYGNSGTTGNSYGNNSTGTTGTHTGTRGTDYGNSTTGTTGNGYGNNSTGTTGTTGTTGAGPHKSGLLNKVDPRVDSDRDGKKGAMD